jgi:hypothetical protein
MGPIKSEVSRSGLFFDDIIGTGNQAVTFAQKHLHDIKIDKYYIAQYN